MTLPINIREEAAFWGRQFVEHAFFTAAGLAAPDQVSMRAAALRLHQMGPAMVSIGPQGVARLARELIALQQANLAAYAPPKWPGWNFPSVIRHMIREEEWFLGLLEDRWTPNDLLCLAARDKSEAAGVMGKLMDPSAEPISRTAESRSEALRLLESRCRLEPFESLAPQVIAEIDAVVALGGSPEVAAAEKAIPLAEILHEGREGTHHIALINRILDQGR